MDEEKKIAREFVKNKMKNEKKKNYWMKLREKELIASARVDWMSMENDTWIFFSLISGY